MKIVNWNWHYKQNINKYLEIIKYNPQILIIQECTKNDFDYIKSQWLYKNWYNDDLNNENSLLGVAIFSNEFKIEFSDLFNRKFRYVIPYVVKRDDFEFYIFSVWIKPYEKDYVKGIEKYLYASKEYYKDMLDKNAIFIGDFNIYAKEDNGRLKILEDKFKPMINCTQDTCFRNAFTYYDSRFGYGIDDFCFISQDIKNKYELEINVPNEWDDKKEKKYRWKGLSDHSPIIINFKEKMNNLA